MREIKFRAYHSKLKQMFYKIDYRSDGFIMAQATWGNKFWHCIGKNSVCELPDDHLYLNHFHNNGTETFPYYQGFIELMQYTGLKDKSGKEIYEGDVVKYYFVPEKLEYVFQTIFDNGVVSPFREVSSFDDTGMSYLADENQSAVIGNIYENPELLKELTNVH